MFTEHMYNNHLETVCMKNYQLLVRALEKVTRKDESLASELPAYYCSRYIKNSRSVLSRNLN